MIASILLPWSVLAAACHGNRPADSTGAPSSSAVDADGDGFWEFEDCDDTDPAANADAREICDGIDNNCDGRIDDLDPDVDLTTGGQWPADSDGDGFGSSSEVLSGCQPPEGSVDNTDDCDDTAAAVYPDAPEACGDGIDQDCDGRDLRCAPTGVLTVTAAPLQLVGPAASAFGWRLAGGDLDGDGTGDLIVGAPDAANGAAARAGAVGIFLGPLSGALSAPADADAWIPGASEEDGLGQAVAAADGVLVFSAPVAGPSDAGLVAVASVDSGLPSALSELAVFTGTPSEGAGHSLVLSDLDDDGAVDLLIGALGDSRGGFGAGAVWMVSDVRETDGGDLADEAAASLLGAEGDSASWALAAEDLNGDGAPDLVVGTPSRGGQGGVFVVDGPVSADALLADAGRFVAGAYAGFRCGESVVASSDLTGDGLADLVVGDPSHAGTDGAAWLLPGPVPPGVGLEEQAQATWTGRTDDRLGKHLAVVGDIDDDGWAELGISGNKVDQSWLFYGPVSGAQGPSTAGARLTGSPGEAIGSAISGIGDTDGDGYDDVVWSDSTVATVFGYFGGRR